MQTTDLTMTVTEFLIDSAKIHRAKGHVSFPAAQHEGEDVWVDVTDVLQSLPGESIPAKIIRLGA